MLDRWLLAHSTNSTLTCRTALKYHHTTVTTYTIPSLSHHTPSFFFALLFCVINTRTHVHTYSVATHKAGYAHCHNSQEQVGNHMFYFPYRVNFEAIRESAMVLLPFLFLTAGFGPSNQPKTMRAVRAKGSGCSTPFDCVKVQRNFVTTLNKFCSSWAFCCSPEEAHCRH